MLRRRGTVRTLVVALIGVLATPAVALAQYVDPSQVSRGTDSGGAAGSSGAGGSATTGGSLPVTGIQLGLMITVALVLLAAGTALVLHNRRSVNS